MKKIIRLTETDLTKIVKRVINEQKFQILSKLLKNSGDDLVAKYGDDAAKQIDNILATAMSNPRNIGVNAAGNQVFNSLSGSKVEFNQISRILNAVSKGANFDELANGFPGKLADGTDFREVVRGLLKNKQPISGVGAVGLAGAKLSNFAPGTLVHSTSFKDDMINWVNVSFAKNLNDYNKMIATALQTGNFQSISRGGFEKYGIPNFREFLMKSVNKDKKIMISPSTGQWYFQVL
jgi:hypothetical protein